MTHTPPGIDPADLLTPGEVARLFSVHPATITRWVKTGTLLPAFDRGGIRLYSRAEIDRLQAELRPDWPALLALAEQADA